MHCGTLAHGWCISGCERCMTSGLLHDANLLDLNRSSLKIDQASGGRARITEFVQGDGTFAGLRCTSRGEYRCRYRHSLNAAVLNTIVRLSAVVSFLAPLGLSRTENGTRRYEGLARNWPEPQRILHLTPSQHRRISTGVTSSQSPNPHQE